MGRMPHFPFHTAHKNIPKEAAGVHSSKVPFTALDRIVLVISVLYPLSAVPQIIDVFAGRAQGVSIISWSIFLICTAFFLTYGIRRKVLPMIVSNSLWVVMDTLVIVGISIQL